MLVHPGREEEFIAAWTDLTHWTMQAVLGKVRSIPLYRDLQQSNRFFCPIAWENVEAIAAWRANQGTQNRIEQFCAELEARTLLQVSRLFPSA